MNRAFPEKLGALLDEVMPKTSPADPIKINGRGVVATAPSITQAQTSAMPRPSIMAPSPAR